MAKNYLIGIGGTGARVVEAIVHCCAAGLGPAQLTTFIIDPDAGNGNLNRTKALVSEYQRCRQGVAGGGGGDGRPYGTQLDTPPSFVWEIFTDQNRTLGAYTHHGNLRDERPALADFLEVLFSKEERETRLNEGFRGHPNIGAVVMANASEKIEPWLSFWSDVDRAGEHEVRVFLVGSVFGGTGAAGVPTFGAPAMLKRHHRALLDASAGSGPGAARAASRVFLGGALVLPYFSFELRADAPTDGQMFVTPADFPIATKAALQYYAEKEAAGDLAFDQVYLIGDSAPQPVGGFAPGNVKQDNRPHYVELATALAAFDFFEQDFGAEALHAGKRFFAASREDAGVVDWRALPVARDAATAEARRTRLKLRLAAMTVFAYMYLTLGRRTLETPHEAVRDPWYRDHFRFDAKRGDDAAKNPRNDPATLDVVEASARHFLEWVGALHDEEDRVRLVDRRQLFDGAAGAAPGTWTLRDPRVHDAAVGALLAGEVGERWKFPQFVRELNAVSLAAEEMPAASRYVHLFHDAALRFAAGNWGLASRTA
jgi:hypothetical protein